MSWKPRTTKLVKLSEAIYSGHRGHSLNNSLGFPLAEYQKKGGWGHVM